VVDKCDFFIDKHDSISSRAFMELVALLLSIAALALEGRPDVGAGGRRHGADAMAQDVSNKTDAMAQDRWSDRGGQCC
jgi:hypothetical protein